MVVDLNADVGESGIGRDDELLTIVTSANIACGFHAGDPSVMRHTLLAAADCGVALGAHPGFADPGGFGRRDIDASPLEIANLVLYQIGALQAIARAEGLALRHVKPHGALYNMSARRQDIADAIARAIASYDNTLMLVGLSGSHLLAAGVRAGLRVAAEGFADRSYEPDGSLTPRDIQGSVLVDPVAAADRAVRMAKEKVVLARDGSLLPVPVDTICVHGDTAEALAMAKEVRRALERAGVLVQNLKSII